MVCDPQNKNPAFRGWIHQFYLVDQIQALKNISSPLQLIDPTNSRVETLDIPGFEEFDPQFTDGVQGQLKACYWLRPMRWNRAIYVGKTLGEETTVEIYVLVPNSVAQPELKIKNDWVLAAFKVGNGEEKWEFAQARRHILFRRLKTKEKGPLAGVA